MHIVTIWLIPPCFLHSFNKNPWFSQNDIQPPQPEKCVMNEITLPPVRDPDLVAQDQQYLTFLVDQKVFAVDIADVKELIEIPAITHIPMTPPFIRGVINLRGNVVPVIDLAARVGHKNSAISKRSTLILVSIEVHQETHVIAMMVDEVNEIITIPQTDIQPPPDFGADLRTDFIKGMGKVGETFLILLAINRVLSINELSKLQHITDSVSQNTAVQ
jgi:purine-binding chemotaxis protein CheW